MNESESLFFLRAEALLNFVFFLKEVNMLIFYRLMINK